MNMLTPTLPLEAELRRVVQAALDSVAEQRDSAEHSLRAQRRAGKVLATVELGTGRPSKTVSRVTLSDLGVTKVQAHRWRLLASIPDADFEAYVATAAARNRELTIAGALKLAKSLGRAKATRDEDLPTGFVSDLRPLVERGERFACIYADPPWRFDNAGSRSAAEGEYATMSMVDLAVLPVATLAAEQAHLHLWACNAMLPEALELMAAWGFAYKGNFVWVKPGIGVGNYWRNRHELLLLGVRGGLPFGDKGLPSSSEHPRGRHSEKPYAVRELVERATPGPRLELFGRAVAKGWTVFGNQLLEGSR